MINFWQEPNHKISNRMLFSIRNAKEMIAFKRLKLKKWVRKTWRSIKNISQPNNVRPANSWKIKVHNWWRWMGQRATIYCIYHEFFGRLCLLNTHDTDTLNPRGNKHGYIGILLIFYGATIKQYKNNIYTVADWHTPLHQ